MATIPNIAPQPQEQLQLNADVQIAFTSFRARSPLGEMVTVVPNELMVQIVALWIQSHPQDATKIIQEWKKKQSAELDIIRTVNSTKNG